jgi:2'-5' RNA ligase
MRAFLFALEITPMQVGMVYPEGLKLHCTVLHWFRTEASASDVQTAAATIIRKAPPIELIAQSEAWFGPSAGPRDILVNVVKPNAEFRRLHGKLYSAMRKLGIRNAEPAYVKEGFIAHVTKQGDEQFVKGSRHTAVATYLIEALDPAAITRKKILARIEHAG